MSDETSSSDVEKLLEKGINVDVSNILCEVSCTEDNLSDLSDDPELAFADYVKGHRKDLGSTVSASKSYDDLKELNFAQNYLDVDKYKTRNIVDCSDDSLDDLKQEKKLLDGAKSDDFDDLKAAGRAVKGKRHIETQIRNVISLQSWGLKRFYLYDEGLVELCRVSTVDYRWVEGLKPKYLKWEPHWIILDKEEMKASKVR